MTTQCQHDDITLVGISKVEVKTRPSIPDNICNWKVLNNDDDLLSLLHCIDVYESQEINFNAFVETIDGKDIVFENEIVHLKTNKIPKGLVALERVFNS